MHTRKNEIEVSEFTQKIMDMISEFAETQSMDEMLILDPRIANDWPDCTQCESRVCETQGNAYGFIISRILSDLKEEF